MADKYVIKDQYGRQVGEVKQTFDADRTIENAVAGVAAIGVASVFALLWLFIKRLWSNPIGMISLLVAVLGSTGFVTSLYQTSFPKNLLTSLPPLLFTTIGVYGVYKTKLLPKRFLLFGIPGLLLLGVPGFLLSGFLADLWDRHRRSATPNAAMPRANNSPSFCIMCGGGIPGHARFCPACGAKQPSAG